MVKELEFLCILVCTCFKKWEKGKFWPWNVLFGGQNRLEKRTFIFTLLDTNLCAQIYWETIWYRQGHGWKSFKEKRTPVITFWRQFRIWIWFFWIPTCQSSLFSSSCNGLFESRKVSIWWYPNIKKTSLNLPALSTQSCECFVSNSAAITQKRTDWLYILFLK